MYWAKYAICYHDIQSLHRIKFNTWNCTFLHSNCIHKINYEIAWHAVNRERQGWTCYPGGTMAGCAHPTSPWTSQGRPLFPGPRTRCVGSLGPTIEPTLNDPHCHQHKYTEKMKGYIPPPPPPPPLQKKEIHHWTSGHPLVSAPQTSTQIGLMIINLMTSYCYYTSQLKSIISVTVKI